MEYVGTKEAAAILGVNPSRVRQLLAEGKLEGVKIGRDWMLARSDVERLASLKKSGKASAGTLTKP